jgi:hypothetical protein
MINEQCPDEIVPDKSISTTLRNTPLTYKHDSAGSFSITGNQLNRVYVRARDYAKLYWSTCSVLFRPDTVNEPCVPDMSEDNVLKFKNIQRMLRHPYVIYSDFESILKPIHTCEPNPESSYTHKTQFHIHSLWLWIIH